MKTKIVSLTALALVAALGHAHASGFATYFAVVNSTGVVLASSGVASSTKTAVGKHEITFNRDIGGCAMLVNVNSPTPAYGNARKKPGTTDVMQVFLYNSGGALIDFGFNVLISCNS